MRKEIKYLLKFVKQKEHVETLLNGILYMRPAAYYHKGESGKYGQNDIREAAVSNELQVYKHSHCPIYCMTAVAEADIDNGQFIIPEKCIQDFECENGYVVIFKFDVFAERLKTLLSEGYCVCGGLVDYHIITFDEMGQLMGDDSPKNLFIKHPYFSYQKEFRIVVCKELYKINEPIREHKEYRFPDDLWDISTCRHIPELHQKGQYILPLPQNEKDFKQLN